SLLAPRRVPHHFVDLLDGELSKSGFRSVATLDGRLERDEPLLRSAEDDGMMAAPTMRIGVLELSAAQQRAALFQHGDDDRIRGKDFHSVEGRRVWRVPRGRID